MLHAAAIRKKNFIFLSLQTRVMSRERKKIEKEDLMNYCFAMEFKLSALRT